MKNKLILPFQDDAEVVVAHEEMLHGEVAVVDFVDFFLAAVCQVYLAVVFHALDLDFFL
jgi:hypothetical protein